MAIIMHLIWQWLFEHVETTQHFVLFIGENVQLTDDEFGSSYLLLVVNCTALHNEKSYLPMLHELALAGCDPNLADYTGASPLS